MIETKETWKLRQIADAAALIEAEADAAEARLLASGSRAPVMTSGHRHFEWFVRYQVLGESQQHIAHENYVQPVTVREAIREIAKRVGLSLRERDRGGRPRKAAA